MSLTSERHTKELETHLEAAAIQVCEIPQQRTNTVIKVRDGTFTIRYDENGCHAIWAMAFMIET